MKLVKSLKLKLTRKRGQTGVDDKTHEERLKRFEEFGEIYRQHYERK